MQSQRTNEMFNMPAADYDAAVGRMKLGNVSIEELTDDEGNRIARVPHNEFVGERNRAQARARQLAKARQSRRKQASAARRNKK